VHERLDAAPARREVVGDDQRAAHRTSLSGCRPADRKVSPGSRLCRALTTGRPPQAGPDVSVEMRNAATGAGAAVTAVSTFPLIARSQNVVRGCRAWRSATPPPPQRLLPAGGEPVGSQVDQFSVLAGCPFARELAGPGPEAASAGSFRVIPGSYQWPGYPGRDLRGPEPRPRPGPCLPHWPPSRASCRKWSPSVLGSGSGKPPRPCSPAPPSTSSDPKPSRPVTEGTRPDSHDQQAETPASRSRVRHVCRSS